MTRRHWKQERLSTVNDGCHWLRLGKIMVGVEMSFCQGNMMTKGDLLYSLNQTLKVSFCPDQAPRGPDKEEAFDTPGWERVPSKVNQH